ncbi:hypothetical protein D3C73_844110 [compost metagenome]
MANNLDVRTAFTKDGVAADLTWRHQHDIDNAKVLADDGVLIDDTLKVICQNYDDLVANTGNRVIEVAIVADPAGILPRVAILGHGWNLYEIDMFKADLNLLVQNTQVSDHAPRLKLENVRVPSRSLLPMNETIYEMKGMQFTVQVHQADMDGIFEIFAHRDFESVIALLGEEVAPTRSRGDALPKDIYVRLLSARTEKKNRNQIIVEAVYDRDEPRYMGRQYVIDGHLGFDLVAVDQAFALHDGWTIRLTHFKEADKEQRFGSRSHPIGETSVFGRGRGDYETLAPQRERSFGRGREDRYENTAGRGGERTTTRGTEHVHTDPRIPTREWIPQINQYVRIEGEEALYYIADYDQYKHVFLLALADSCRRERQARVEDSRSAEKNPGLIEVEPGRLRPFVLFH